MTVKRFAHITLVITSPAKVTIVGPPQLSVAVILPGLGAGTSLAHCTVTLAGQVMDAMLSTTV